MIIEDIISTIKSYHRGTDMNGKAIDESNTRDKVLYGNPTVECTGIITTCWASTKVIEEAIKENANLIICHEALFWNHGDETEWLINENNKIFQKKKSLLDESGIVVWRNHDYVHSGIPIAEGKFTDGIFYGLAEKLGWEKYLVDIENPFLFNLPTTTSKEITRLLIDKLSLNGAKIIGSTNVNVNKVFICGHVMGGDNSLITQIDSENIDTSIALELIDYTLTEYIYDASFIENNKSIITVGHFNLEEPGMEYMVKYLDELFEDLPIKFVQSGDMYSYIV